MFNSIKSVYIRTFLVTLKMSNIFVKINSYESSKLYRFES